MAQKRRALALVGQSSEVEAAWQRWAAPGRLELDWQHHLGDLLRRRARRHHAEALTARANAWRALSRIADDIWRDCPRPSNLALPDPTIDLGKQRSWGRALQPLVSDGNLRPLVHMAKRPIESSWAWIMSLGEVDQGIAAGLRHYFGQEHRDGSLFAPARTWLIGGRVLAGELRRFAEQAKLIADLLGEGIAGNRRRGGREDAEMRDLLRWAASRKVGLRQLSRMLVHNGILPDSADWAPRGGQADLAAAELQADTWEERLKATRRRGSRRVRESP